MAIRHPGARKRGSIAGLVPSQEARPFRITDSLERLIGAMAEPRIAALVALLAYLLRIALAPDGFQATKVNYFSQLADAFLHGQLHLRQQPEVTIDLVFYADKLYLYWYPFPSILLMPLVALFGVDVSDFLYTAIIGAATVGLVAKLLQTLDTLAIAPLPRERRGLLVLTVAFGSLVPILSVLGGVWLTSQIISWACVLCGTIAALALPTRWGYFLTGLAFACAANTRIGLLCAGVWLAYYMLHRDWQRPLAWRVSAVVCAALPVMVGFLLLGWYNWARFGHPLETGLAWHNMSAIFREDYARYGIFNVHYLPLNLYHQFLAPPITKSQGNIGWGFFWMTPVFIGGLTAVWRERHKPLVWSLVASCFLIYVPIGLVMGTSYLFGPRYMLDLMVPLLVLTALGIRHWRRDLLRAAVIVSIMTFTLGSGLLLWFDYIS